MSNEHATRLLKQLHGELRNMHGEVLADTTIMGYVVLTMSAGYGRKYPETGIIAPNGDIVRTESHHTDKEAIDRHVALCAALVQGNGMSALRAFDRAQALL
jgi:hypothetical protein